MTTAAAIDRLVHHATILEMAGPSVRADTAAARKETTTQPTTTTPTTTTHEPQPSTMNDGAM
jgi:hypothetical protein